MAQEHDVMALLYDQKEKELEQGNELKLVVTLVFCTKGQKQVLHRFSL